MRQHLFVQHWGINGDWLIKAGALFFAVMLWPIFAALELTWRMLAIFDRRRP
jgi:hypothetical protein